jgi:hypothetical protein
LLSNRLPDLTLQLRQRTRPSIPATQQHDLGIRTTNPPWRQLLPGTHEVLHSRIKLRVFRVSRNRIPGRMLLLQVTPAQALQMFQHPVPRQLMSRHRQSHIFLRTLWQPPPPFPLQEI